MTQPTQNPVEAVDAKRDLLHDRRALALIGGGLVAVAAIGLFVVKPMLGGSSSSDTGAVANAHVHRAVATSPSPSASPTPSVTAAPTPAPKLVVRDPFSPLVVAASAAAGGSGASAAPSAASTTPITQVSTIIVPEPGPTVTRSVASSTPAKAKYTLVFVKVVSAATGTIQVRLNGTTYTLNKTSRNFPDAVNGPFALTALFTSINGKASTAGPAEFAYGDDTFSMSVGETQYEN